MLNFNNASEISIGGKQVSKIEINNVIVWESLKSITLSASSNSVYWGQDVTLTATVSPAKSDLTVDFGDGLTATTNSEGIATVTVNKSTPQQAEYMATIGNKTSNNVSVNWNKRNLTITPLHKGTLYYGHYLRYRVQDSVSNDIVTGLSGYINYGAGSNYSVSVNSSGYCQLQLNVGTKTTTTATTYTNKCKITGNELYNDSTEYTQSYSYQPSLKFSCRISSASTDSACTSTHGSSGEYYGKWYKSSTASSLASALYDEGSVHSYLASSSGSASCKRPEELYAKTDGKDFNGNTKSGTVLAIEYYMTASRTDNSSAPITVKGFNMYLQLYSSGEWTTKSTLSDSTTLTATSTAKTGTFSFTPTMSQLTSGYIRLVCYFVANTSGNLGYVYIQQLYPRVWYSPTQSFNS